MSSYLLKLGSAGFTIDDLPEELPIGGKQLIALRELPGGKVHIQTFGCFEDEISWQGEFLTGDALNRARTIDHMRWTGNRYLLQFGTIARYVVITKFIYKYMNNNRVGYEISLQPDGTSLKAVSVGSKKIKKYSTPKSHKSTTKKKPSPVRTYTVKKGDTMWSIAHHYYGNALDWHKIAKANPKVVPTKMKVGTKLKIP